MIKKIFLGMVISSSFLFGVDKGEKLFWDEVKDSNDVELLKLYKKRYPKGVFEPIADLKIKRLLGVDTLPKNSEGIPLWIDGKSIDHRFYGVGEANKHFKGKHYQENLSRSRAKEDLMKKFEKANLSSETIYEYIDLMKMEIYTDQRGKIYTLLYVDNYDLQ